jgi:hypothetical protein
MSRWKSITVAVMVLIIAIALLAAPALAAGRHARCCFFTSYVRFAHASPDAPPVDVWVDGKKVVSNLAFTGVTHYKGLRSGRHKVEVVPAGATTPVVISAEVKLSACTYYTVAATNVLAKIAPVIYVDKNKPAAWGKAKVRFIHLSPNAPAVDIAVSGGGPTLFSNISFTQASCYIQVPKGTYSLDVKLAGTNTVVLTVPNVKLKQRMVYTVFAEGLVGGSPPQQLQAVLVMYAPWNWWL